MTPGCGNDHGEGFTIYFPLSSTIENKGHTGWWCTQKTAFSTWTAPSTSPLLLAVETPQLGRSMGMVPLNLLPKINTFALFNSAVASSHEGQIGLSRIQLK